MIQKAAEKVSAGGRHFAKKARRQRGPAAEADPLDDATRPEASSFMSTETRGMPMKTRMETLEKEISSVKERTASLEGQVGLSSPGAGAVAASPEEAVLEFPS